VLPGSFTLVLEHEWFCGGDHCVPEVLVFGAERDEHAGALHVPGRRAALDDGVSDLRSTDVGIP
jgi:hypothetical protein